MRRISSLAVVVLAILLFVPPALADDGLTRTTWPSAEDPGPPYYARIEGNRVFNDGEMAAIVFYRDPNCVPAGFNLLSFFDAPAAFACQLTVEGASLWKEPLVGAPKTLTARGAGAVPVWFVPVDSIDQATQDGVLTIGELAALDGLVVGTASQFNEVLQPVPLPPEFGGGGHPNPKIIIRTHGSLEDGRLFNLVINGVKNVVDFTQIQFQ